MWGRSDFNFDQVALGVEHGHAQAFDSADFRVSRKASNLGIWLDSFHRPDATLVGNQMTRKCNEVRELCERARDDYIEKTWDFDSRMQILDTPGHDRQITQPKLQFCLGLEGRFLVDDVVQRDLPVGQDDRHDDSRQTAARANVERRLRPGAASDKGNDRERVEDVLDQHLARIAVRLYTAFHLPSNAT